MGKGALIIGGSVAGIQAALDLANSGIEVHLVEPTPFLGSNGSTTVPQHLLNSRLLEVAKHPKVTCWTNTRVNRASGEAGDFFVELRQHPRYVDLTKCTACKDCLDVCPVTLPGSDQKAIHLTASAQPGCAAIDKLGKAPCSNTCPGGIHVQGYVALIAQGRFQEAIDLIREAIPFPGICGRICTHPCEVNCRRAEVDKPVAIRLLKRFVSDWQLLEQGEDAGSGTSGVGNPDSGAQSPDAPRVAIVGAGPGGMAVADRLARLGYGVTVFEKLPIIGGMMAMGIPEYRLPRQVIAREYQQVQELGVQVRLNTAVGPDGDHSLDDLFAMGYQAVCLAVGAHRSHALRLAGEELPGVVQGIELLTTISLSQQMGTAQYQAELQRMLQRGSETRAAVLGGGNTAMDVARCLKRLGIHKVRILYRRTRAEMPALPEEIEEAEREGIPIEFLVAPVRFLGDAVAGVTGLECQRMKLGEPDASGRRRPVPIAGSEFIIDLDLVVLAIGQAPDLGFLGANHTIAVTREERINVDAVSFMTSRPGVFAIGDAVTTDKMAVIEAIGMGKKAAAAIDAYVKGVPPHETVVDAREVPIARREMTAEELAPKPRTLAPTIPMAQRLSSYAEVELGYAAQQAVAEAQRCLVCGPCSECLACVRACKPGAVVHDQQERFVELQIGAVINADDSTRAGEFPLVPGGVGGLGSGDAREPAQGVYRVPPDGCHSPLLGSAAAARAMFDLFAERTLLPAPPVADVGTTLEMRTAEPRIGVFVCRCGDQIAAVVDTQTVCDRAALWSNVVHTQSLSFSCSPQASEGIDQAISTHALNRVVLAACSCCSIDQVCYSCTYQRVRCKENLGIFAHVAGLMGGHGDTETGRQGIGQSDNKQLATFEFVNIREQCAWVHADDPQAATAKATALVAAAVARARLAAPGVPAERRPVDRSVLILGSGAAGLACARALGTQGIAAARLPGLPLQIERASGAYHVAGPGPARPAGVLVLSPCDAGETEQLLAAFGEDGHRPRTLNQWGGLETHRPGVFVCDPSLSAETSGPAVAARVAAWLGQEASTPVAGRTDLTVAAVVDPARCRACATCVELCEFGAPQLVGQEPRRASWIDPAMCTGCGTCAAHCPSGAITPGYVTDRQLEGMLEQVAGCVVIFTCNWNAYSGLESAGVQRLAYSAATRPIKVLCLGQLHPGLVLKALAKGANGVLLLGCPPGECHYEFGQRHAKEAFAEAKKLAALLGYRDCQLQLEWVAAGQGEDLAAKVQAFVTGLHGG